MYSGMPGAGAGEEIAKRGDPASPRTWHSYVWESSSGGNWTPRLKNLELSVSFTARSSPRVSARKSKGANACGAFISASRLRYTSAWELVPASSSKDDAHD